MIWEWRKICSVTNPFRVWRQTKKVDLFCYKEHYTWSQNSRFAIILFLLYKSINQSIVLSSYYLCKLWNVNPFSVLKINFISLINYICNVLIYIYMYVNTIFNPTRFIINSNILSAFFHFYAFMKTLSSAWNPLLIQVMPSFIHLILVAFI